MGKRAARKLEEVNTLMAQGPTGMVAERLPSPGVGERPSGLLKAQLSAWIPDLTWFGVAFIKNMWDLSAYMGWEELGKPPS